MFRNDIENYEHTQSVRKENRGLKKADCVRGDLLLQ